MTFVRILSVFLSFGIWGCLSVPPSSDAGGGRVVTVASDATFAPFHYIDSDGTVTGFDIELARQIGERLEMRVEVEVVLYDRLFSDLLAGRYQVVAATTGITAEREKRYLFSEPYFLTCQTALVRAGADETGSLMELAGRNVGAAGAGTSVEALSLLPESVPILLSEREATEVSILDDGRVPALENREIDALIVDEFDAVLAARRSGGHLRVLRDPVALERYGFVFAPTDGDLKQQFDAALETMRRDGSLLALERAFGLDRGPDWPVRLPR
ncbi:MAG: ABC transporter substrate-binding protein [Pseudomonadota bacterium]